MNYEKRYKETLERAKDYFKANQRIGELEENDILSDIFPELKESKDEKMRKSIIYALRNGGFYDNDKTDEAIAWLEKQGQNNSQVTLPPFMFDDILALQCCMETVKKVQEDKDLYEKLKDLHGRVYDAYQLGKQGEQKPIDDLTQQEAMDITDTKFKIRDWVVYNRNNHSRKVMQIYDIRDNRYYFNDNIHFSWSVKECDEKSHLWTIEDAKDGDVLCLDYIIAIFKKHIGNEECICYCSFCDDGDFEIPIENGEDNVYGCTSTTPATKEQRDLLFTKMREAGYEWDANKKELIKL